MKQVGAGILGDTGYGGLELMRLLAGHPGAVLRAASSRRHAGRPLASVAVPLACARSQEEMDALYAGRYAGHPFVRVLAEGALPETRHVRASNRCDVAVRTAASGTMLLAFAAIDNLVKGAAGQSIQNWNRLQGWPETTGLPLDGWAIA